MQHLWQIGFHACALTRGKKNSSNFHSISPNKNRTDAAGLLSQKSYLQSAPHKQINKFNLCNSGRKEAPR
jgi:hypothetical protein